MSYVIAAIAVGTVGFALLQGWLIRQLRYQYSRPTAAWPSERPWPNVTIVLSLRGRDPFLESCITNLIQQDYPDFRLKVIVDSESDPAWGAIHAIQAEFGARSFDVSVLRERRRSCSLKNSSILQALGELPRECEIVAFVDADAITHPSWLRELVTPLADSEVGCTTGIRWFAPADHSLATRMRCYWNVVAASMIYNSSTPWGGSMAVRRSVLESGLAEEWSRMFCEDAHTISHLTRRGLKLVCVPEATIANLETTSISGCVRFVNRQMLIFRLYHKMWWAVVAMILFCAVLRGVHIDLIIRSAIHGAWTDLVLLLCIHPAILLVTKYEAWRLDSAARKMMQGRGRQVPNIPMPEFFGYFATEVMFLVSLIYSLSARQVTWRGIKYRIHGPQKIKMLGYRSFEGPSVSGSKVTATVV